MNSESLYLKVPTSDELDYRIKICADKDTMDYNFGYGDDGAGCYYITQEQAKTWLKYWTSSKTNFYAYVIRGSDDCPVGEVNFHFDNDRQKYFIGVVIEARHRGRGYAIDALDLLAKKAFGEYGITELYNDFPPSRLAAEKAHKKVGFERINDELVVLTAKNYELIKQRNDSIKILTGEIQRILGNVKPSMMLYGSLVLEDFKLGWSDIDFLCITEGEMSSLQASALLTMRQEMSDKNPQNCFFKLFEGVIINKQHLLSGEGSNIVYWGTTGQKIIERFGLDAFSSIELIDNGKLLLGNDFRNILSYPTKEQIVAAIKRHYEAIRKYAATTGESLYSAGWMLDIARCLYTVRTGKVISKTKAGEWAVDNNLCPTPSVMEKVLKIRNNPTHFKSDPNTLNWLGTLNPHIQQFADILEKELIKTLKRAVAYELKRI